MDNLNPLATLYDAARVAIASALDSAGTNRLCVQTAPAAGVAISQPAIGSGPAAKTIFSWLSTTGGGPTNNSMLVNGATTPQVFYFTPKVATLMVYYVRIVMCGASFATSGASFGGAGSGGLLGSNNPAALTKGLQISCTVGGVQTVLYTMTVNEDFVALNNSARCIDMGAGNVLVGEMYFNQVLTVNSGDQVAVTIQDNMLARNITSLRASFCGVRP